ncbi:helix-turn-helix transcriptional regulator [Porticoccaceae bacterium nBUS_17]
MLAAETLQKSIDITNACLTARNEEDLENIWLLMQELSNIDGLLLFVSESARDVNDLEASIIVRSYGINDDWHDVYVDRKFALIDPVLKMLWQTGGDLVSWQEAFDKHGRGAEEFIETAARLGLTEGYTVATQSNDFSGIACSVSAIFESKNLSDGDHDMIKILLPHLNRVLARPGFLRSHNLTEKQIEVLKWAGENKSYWEVGTIMGISERTVKFHFKNIFRKLGVASRGEAIIKGKIKGVI